MFRRPIIAKPSKITKVVQAACALHNYLKITEALSPPSAQYYCPPGFIDQEDRQGNVIPGNWRSEGDNGLQSVTRVGSNRYSSSDKQSRDDLAEYFNASAGELPWQQGHVTSI